jgi:hypothetical protein
MNEVIKHEKPRVIQGVILKCVDGRWKDKDGLTPPDTLLAMGTARCVQCWKDQQPVDTIVETADEPLPDVDELNSPTPKKEWEKGLDGKPRPPWQVQFVVYLIDAATGSTWTFINSTTGARIAYERLTDKFRFMRRLRGDNIAPVIKLDAHPMKTSFGQKMRPEFTVVEWRDLGNGGPTLQIEHKAEPAAIETEPTVKPAPATTKQKKPKVGKPVKPVTLQEELNDDLPNHLKAG